MIDNDHFVFATHFPPATSSLFFYSPVLDGVVEYTIDTFSYVALDDPVPANPAHNLKSDLSVGTLTTTLNPAHGITSYAILDLDTTAEYVGKDLLVYGFDNAPLDASNDVLNTVDDNDTLTMSFTQGVADGGLRITLPANWSNPLLAGQWAIGPAKPIPSQCVIRRVAFGIFP